MFDWVTVNNVPLGHEYPAASSQHPWQPEAPILPGGWHLVLCWRSLHRCEWVQGSGVIKLLLKHFLKHSKVIRTLFFIIELLEDAAALKQHAIQLLYLIWMYFLMFSLSSQLSKVPCEAHYVNLSVSKKNNRYWIEKSFNVKSKGYILT